MKGILAGAAVFIVGGVIVAIVTKLTGMNSNTALLFGFISGMIWMKVSIVVAMLVNGE